MRGWLRSSTTRTQLMDRCMPRSSHVSSVNPGARRRKIPYSSYGGCDLRRRREEERATGGGGGAVTVVDRGLGHFRRLSYIAYALEDQESTRPLTGYPPPVCVASEPNPMKTQLWLSALRRADTRSRSVSEREGPWTGVDFTAPTIFDP
jgi:hypothetical protein